MPFDMQRLIAASVLAATALFLMSQRVGSDRGRRAMRIAAVAVYGALAGVVVIYIGLWLAGAVPAR
jgi:hypothetical protein